MKFLAQNVHFKQRKFRSLKFKKFSVRRGYSFKRSIISLHAVRDCPGGSTAAIARLLLYPGSKHPNS